jgi:hypothetical protein
VSFWKNPFGDRESSLAEQAEQLLMGHFSTYWERHPSTPEQRQEVLRLIHELISMTASDVLRRILDATLPPFITAGILDKIADRVYGGNSTFFLKLLTQR